jgi:aminoglycoside phosphotransferase (APT) family kinase protein
MAEASSPVDSPAPVRAGEALDLAGLEGYLTAHLPGISGGLEVLQFPAGYSNLTYLVRVEVNGEPRDLVLRRPPFGSEVATAHDMGREHRVLTGLATVWDAAVLGAPFYLMERVEGVILRGRPPAGIELTPARMRGLSASFVDTFAELHGLEPAAAGLADLGRPEGYVERQVRGWTKRYLAAKTDEVPEVERAAAWLADHLPREPASPPTALIHNDFKLDNLVLDPLDLTRVVAVLDWEMATVGDPLMDLGSSLAYWIDPDDPEELVGPAVPHLTARPGSLRRGELVERYLAASGRELPAGTGPVFYYVYGQLKLAGIVQQIFYRFRRGLTRDPRFAGLGELVQACGKAAELAIEKNRIDRLTA